MINTIRFILFASLLLPCISHAGLIWTATTVEHVMIEGTQKAEVAFAFTIEGDQPVTLTELKSSCDCTVAKLDKRTYQPGETGKVIAEFTPGNRYGVQQKEIYVRTNEPGVRAQTLTLKVKLPDLVTMDTRQLIWKSDDEPRTQTIAIKTAGGVILELRPLAAAQAAQIDVKLEGNSKGAYRLEAHPLATDKPLRVPVLLYVKKDGQGVPPAIVILRVN